MKPRTFASFVPVFKNVAATGDLIEEGSHYFDRLDVSRGVDRCVATVEFRDGENCFLRMHVTECGKFRVGTSGCPMSRAQLSAAARTWNFVAKAGLEE